MRVNHGGTMQKQTKLARRRCSRRLRVHVSHLPTTWLPWLVDYRRRMGDYRQLQPVNLDSNRAQQLLAGIILLVLLGILAGLS